MTHHPDQVTPDEVHHIKKPHGHGLMDPRRDLHNRSPHAANTPVVGQPDMNPVTQPGIDDSSNY